MVWVCRYFVFSVGTDFELLAGKCTDVRLTFLRHVYFSWYIFSS
jgi:hypothetical protein